MNVNPAEFATLLASSSSHAAPLANQVRSASMLLFELICIRIVLETLMTTVFKKAVCVLCGSFPCPRVILLLDYYLNELWLGKEKKKIEYGIMIKACFF